MRADERSITEAGSRLTRQFGLLSLAVIAGITLTLGVVLSFYTTKAQGTGLGLAMARKFTEAYGGTITVHSRVQDGATFRVTFPSVAPASAGA